MKNLIVISTIALLLGLTSVAISRKPSEGRGQYHEMFSELGDNMRQYMEENVFPQMDDWKEQIDNGLSTEDLNKLNHLRAKAKESKDKMREFRKDNRGMRMGKHGRKGKQGNFRNNKKMQEFREKRYAFRDELEEIIDNNQDFLAQIFDEAEIKHNEWKDDLEEIKDNWKEKYENELDDMKGKRKGKNRMKGFSDDKRGDYRYKVLLWDGPMPRMQKQNFNSNLDVKIYNSPNPFSGTTTIYVNISNSKDYKIDIYDAEGNLVENLYSGTLSEGEHSYNFNASDLKPGIYFYKISDGLSEKTGKMILNK